jgi:hypothetical protein
LMLLDLEFATFLIWNSDRQSGTKRCMCIVFPMVCPISTRLTMRDACWILFYAS